MKAEINQFGCLLVEPETQLEAYALMKWCDGYAPFKPGVEAPASGGSTFVVHSGINLPDAKGAKNVQ